EYADAERPQQFGAENPPLVSFSRLLGHGLAHPTPREEDEEIDRQIADHQQGHGEPGHDTGTERHDAHDLSERGFIDLIGYFRRSVSGGRLISGSHRRAPTSCAPANLCETQFYTEAVKRPATSRKSTSRLGSTKRAAAHENREAWPCPAQRLNHTVMPGSNAAASRLGSRRRRSVLRS